MKAALAILLLAALTAPGTEPRQDLNRWQACVDAANAAPDQGTDSDFAECDRLYDPEHQTWEYEDPEDWEPKPWEAPVLWRDMMR